MTLLNSPCGRQQRAIRAQVYHSSCANFCRGLTGLCHSVAKPGTAASTGASPDNGFQPPPPPPPPYYNSTDDGGDGSVSNAAGVNPGADSGATGASDAGPINAGKALAGLAWASTSLLNPALLNDQAARHHRGRSAVLITECMVA